MFRKSLTVCFVLLAIGRFAAAQAPKPDEEVANKLQSAVDAAAAITHAPNNGYSGILRTDPSSGVVGVVFAPRPQNGSTGILGQTALKNGGLISLLAPGEEKSIVTIFAAAGRAPVLEVTSVTGRLDDSKAVLKAAGTVPTGGWSDAAFCPVNARPPADGIYEFTMAAKKPAAGAIVPQVVTPVETREVTIERPQSMKGVRIFSQTNQYVLRFLNLVPANQMPDVMDLIKLKNAKLVQGVLNVSVQFSGGCKRHDFNLVWDGSYRESNPPVAVMRLLHVDNDDPCDGLFDETIHFALPTLDPCVIRIEDGAGHNVEVKHMLSEQ